MPRAPGYLPWEIPCRSLGDDRRQQYLAACTGDRAARRQAQHDPGAAPGEYGWRRLSVHRRTAARGHRRQRRARYPMPASRNARGAAATQPKVAAHANRADIDDARQQLKKARMVESRHRRREGNGHDRIDPGESQGMQTVSRRHQFLRGRRAHHYVRVRIEGDHYRPAAMVTRIANNRVDQFVMPPMDAVEHADGDRRGAQACAIIKRIGGNDAGLIRLAREKDTRELVGGQHHRTPPIACGKTCSITKRPPSIRASALSPPSSTSANGAFDASKCQVHAQ